MAWAQDSAADSTVTTPLNPFADSTDSTATVAPYPFGASADSSAAGAGTGAASSAASDSATIAALKAQLDGYPGFVWIGFQGEADNQRPSIRGSYDADKSRFGPSLDISIPVTALGGFNGTTTYHRDIFEEPSTQQEKSNRLFRTDWSRPMSSWGQFNLDFRHNVNNTERQNFDPSSNTDSALSSALNGRGVLGQSRIDGKWSIRGSITDKNISSGSRAGSSTQKLSKGIFSGGLGRDLGAFKVGINAGMDLSAGPQTLSARTDGSDAQEETRTTLSDTLGVNLRWQGGERRSFTAKLSRQALTEDRLDFAKDTRGVTIFDPNTNEKIVGDEREVRNVLRMDLAAEDRILRSIRYNLRFGIETKETQYSLSQQNFVPEQSQSFGGDVWYRFASAGSLKVSLNFIERWDDRQIQGSDAFRGKHYNNSNSVAITYDQRIMSTSNFRVLYAEDLAQQTYDYKLAVGTQDTDVLGRRLESKLSSKPYDSLVFSILGSYRATSNVFLDPEQVAGNNRDQSNWKVTMDYALAISQAVSFSQSYQLSIDYTDYIYSYLEDDSQRDKYYKRSQLRSELGMSFIQGTRFSIAHSVDRTRGGVKEIYFGVEDEAYTDDPSRRQDEQRIYAGLQIPVWSYSLDLGTNRTIRVLRGVNEEYLGDFRIQLTGQSRFFREHLLLGLNVGHVWAYGPPRVIRIERDKHYFTAATHLTWLF